MCNRINDLLLNELYSARCIKLALAKYPFKSCQKENAFVYASCPFKYPCFVVSFETVVTLFIALSERTVQQSVNFIKHTFCDLEFFNNYVAVFTFRRFLWPLLVSYSRPEDFTLTPPL